MSVEPLYIVTEYIWRSLAFPLKLLTPERPERPEYVIENVVRVLTAHGVKSSYRIEEGQIARWDFDLLLIDAKRHDIHRSLIQYMADDLVEEIHWIGSYSKMVVGSARSIGRRLQQ